MVDLPTATLPAMPITKGTFTVSLVSSPRNAVVVS